MLNEIHRPHFEGCVLTHVMQEIKSRGLCIEGSEKYTDYRDQLISWEEYEQGVEVFCGSGALAHGLPFVKRVRSGLEPIVQDTNVSFSHNNHLTFAPRNHNKVHGSKDRKTRMNTGFLV